MILPEINPNQPIAIDLETCDPELTFTGPGYISDVGFVAGVAVAAKEGSWYIPIHHSKGENYDEAAVIKWLNKILSGDTEKIFHNAQYDLGWLYYMGVNVCGKIFDTMLAAPLLDENRFSYQLDALGKEYFGEGKFEEALRLAVAETFGECRTHKTIIRLKEDVPDDIRNYKPFKEAKVRVTQHYELWPKCVQDRYDVLGTVTSKTGQTEYKVPTQRDKDIKALLWGCDAAEMGTYPIQDVDLTYKLYKLFKQKIAEEHLTNVCDLEMQLVMPLLEMRLHGVRIDMEKAKMLDIAYTDFTDQQTQLLSELCEFDVNVFADTDLVKICEKFGLAYGKTAKGNPCFADDKMPDHEAFEYVREIRKMHKARDVYIRGYLFGCTINGWLKGQYNQLKSDDGGTVTGRLSSSQPNMQNLPNPKKDQLGKDIRGCFLPDNEDEDWLSLDYSGQEPRMLVHIVLAYNKLLNKRNRTEGKCLLDGADVAQKEIFRGKHADFHTAVSTICMKEALDVKGEPYTEEDLKKEVKAFRTVAKTIGLGIMYGRGVPSIAAGLTASGYPITLSEATEIKEQVLTAVPFLKTINNLIMRKAQDRGYIKTILGRKGHFPNYECRCFNDEEQAKLGTSNFYFKTIHEAQKFYNENRHKYTGLRKPQRQGTYKALNKFIQGSSADQTKKAMLDMYKGGDATRNCLDIFYRRIEGYEPPKFKTQVHDEINISKRKTEDAEWFQKIMETCIPLEVEVLAEPVVCSNWAEAK